MSTVEKKRRSASNYSKPIELIDFAIKDESNKISLYEHLKDLSVSGNEKEILNQIQMDCQKHMKILTGIYRKINRMDYAESDIPEPPEPVSMKLQYEKCVFDNLECVDFYRKIYLTYPDNEIRDLIFEIITDKQSHAIKALYLAGLY